MDGFGMQYVSFNIKFVHICLQTALERYLPNKNLNPSQSDHHKTTTEESQCIYRLATLRSTKIHFAMHSFQGPWTFHWLHFQVAVSWSFLYALFLPTILTKHQAFAPSAPIWFRCKSRFFRKAWQEKADGRRVQLFWSNSGSSHSSLPSREFLQLLTKGWGMDGFGMQYVSFNIKVVHICLQTALERYLPNKNLNPSQSDHHKTTTEESQCIYRLATLRSTKIHFAMHSFQGPWTFHWLHFQVAVSWSFLYALFLPTILLTQTPSLCPFSTPLQIQVLQGGVLFKAFGHGLTGESWWTSSPALLIKLWVLSVLILLSWTSLQPRDEGWRIRSIKHW